MDELVDANLRLRTRSRSAQGYRTRSVWVAGGALCVALLAVVFIRARAASVDVSVAIWGVLVVVALGLGAVFGYVYGLYYDRAVRRQYRHVLAEQFGGASHLRCEIELRDEGVWVAQRASRSHSPGATQLAWRIPETQSKFDLHLESWWPETVLSVMEAIVPDFSSGHVRLPAVSPHQHRTARSEARRRRPRCLISSASVFIDSSVNGIPSREPRGFGLVHFFLPQEFPSRCWSARQVPGDSDVAFWNLHHSAIVVSIEESRVGNAAGDFN